MRKLKGEKIKMINNVVLVGRLTKDVELKNTQSGVAVGSFTLAVNRSFKNAEGQREADFINCVIWRKSAENLAKYTSKGSLIGVEGSIQTRNYENQQGQRVYVTEVVVDKFTFLDSKSDGNNQSQGNFNSNQANYSQGNQNFNQSSKNRNNNAFSQGAVNSVPSNQGPEISEDDLPF